jgi:hypothetical protein
MVTSLSVLTRLESLVIEFEFPGCRPDRKSRRPPPPTRTLLPILTELQFLGVSEYLDDFVARIDAPLLNDLMITFFHQRQRIFDTPQLTEFISLTPKFYAYNRALVNLFSWSVSVTLPRPFDGALELGIAYKQPDWQFSFLTQLCSSSFPLIPAVEHLYIQTGSPRLYLQPHIESSQCLQLFRQFAAVKFLYISREIVQCIAPVLQELVEERVIEVLPALQTLFLEETLPSGPFQEAIGQFIAARRLATHPISVSRWKKKSFDD